MDHGGLLAGSSGGALESRSLDPTRPARRLAGAVPHSPSLTVRPAAPFHRERLRVERVAMAAVARVSGIGGVQVPPKKSGHSEWRRCAGRQEEKPARSAPISPRGNGQNRHQYRHP